MSSPTDTSWSPNGATLAATVEPEVCTLVVSGLSRGTITTAVHVSISEPLDGDTSGCSSTDASRGVPWLLLACVAKLRRRKART